jgi:hypothetical protein
MQAHFENIQTIADTTTLPHAMHYLSSRIAEELDSTYLTERLMQMKGKSPEKLELWDRLKVLSMNLSFFGTDMFVIFRFHSLSMIFDLSSTIYIVIAICSPSIGLVLLQASREWCCRCGQ